MKILSLLEDREIFKPERSFKERTISDEKYHKSHESFRDKDFNKNTLKRNPGAPDIFLDKKKKLKVLGTGLGAAAIEHKDSVNEITKISKPTNNLKHDAYFMYINTIIKNNLMQNNPYYPKIYDLKIIKGKFDKKISYRVKMEKLYPLDQLNLEEIEPLIRRIVPDKQIADREHDFEGYGDEYIFSLYFLTSFLEDSFYHSEKTKDKLLDQVIEMVRYLKIKYQEYEYKIDVHELNVMFRRTSIGPQLVITDPLHSDEI